MERVRQVGRAFGRSVQNLAGSANPDAGLGMDPDIEPVGMDEQSVDMDPEQSVSSTLETSTTKTNVAPITFDCNPDSGKYEYLKKVKDQLKKHVLTKLRSCFDKTLKMEMEWFRNGQWSQANETKGLYVAPNYDDACNRYRPNLYMQDVEDIYRNEFQDTEVIYKSKKMEIKGTVTAYDIAQLLKQIKHGSAITFQPNPTKAKDLIANFFLHHDRAREKVIMHTKIMRCDAVLKELDDLSFDIMLPACVLSCQQVKDAQKENKLKHDPLIKSDQVCYTGLLVRESFMSKMIGDDSVATAMKMLAKEEGFDVKFEKGSPSENGHLPDMYPLMTCAPDIHNPNYYWVNVYRERYIDTIESTTGDRRHDKRYVCEWVPAHALMIAKLHSITQFKRKRREYIKAEYNCLKKQQKLLAKIPCSIEDHDSEQHASSLVRKLQKITHDLKVQDMSSDACIERMMATNKELFGSTSKSSSKSSNTLSGGQKSGGQKSGGKKGGTKRSKKQTSKSKKKK